VHGVDKVTSLGHMNNSKFDIVSTAKQKHVKVLRYFEEDGKFSVISSLKPGPLSCVLGVYSIGDKPIVVGGRGVMLYLWNLLDKQQLFSVDCKGWNRHISFALNPENLSNFFISFSSKNILSIYHSNAKKQSVGNECETLRSSLHERETLTLTTLHNPFMDKLYIVTGGEDTEILIAEVKKDQLDLQKSLNYHTSSIRVIKKLVKEISETSHKYYIATAGSQMVINLFEIEMSADGFEIIHLAKLDRKAILRMNNEMKADQDFRIMDIDIKITNSHLLVFVASSSGHYHCVASPLDAPKLIPVISLTFDTALLCIKAVKTSDGFTVFAGSNKGKLITIRQKIGKFNSVNHIGQSTDDEWSAVVVETVQAHQIGINVIDMKDNYLCTGSDDQHISLHEYDPVTSRITKSTSFYSHHSSVKALKFFKLSQNPASDVDSKDQLFMVSSSYDQIGRVWKVTKSLQDSTNSINATLTSIAQESTVKGCLQFRHTLPDVFDVEVSSVYLYLGVSL